MADTVWWIRNKNTENYLCVCVYIILWRYLLFCCILSSCFHKFRNNQPSHPVTNSVKSFIPIWLTRMHNYTITYIAPTLSPLCIEKSTCLQEKSTCLQEKSTCLHSQDRWHFCTYREMHTDTHTHKKPHPHALQKNQQQKSHIYIQQKEFISLREEEEEKKGEKKVRHIQRTKKKKDGLINSTSQRLV